METTKVTIKKISNLRIVQGIVVVGDIHAYNHYPYNNHDQIVSRRLRDIEKAMWEVGYTARKLELPLIMNGDIIHTGLLDYPVEEVLKKFFMEFSDIKIIINSGNHDLDGEKTVLSPFIAISKIPNHVVLESPITIKIRNINFLFIPFCSDKNVISTIKEYEPNKKTKNVLIIHGTIKGSYFNKKAKAKSGIDEELISNKFDFVIASHIHKYQVFYKGKGFYTSSLIPLDFSETNNEHGYHIINFDLNKRYFVIPDAPKFKVINFSDLDRVPPKRIDGNILRINNDTSEYMDQRKITEKLKGLGVSFITFKNQKRRKENKGIIIKDTSNAESIVSKYSSILSEKLSLKSDTLETVGLDILRKAKIEMDSDIFKRR